jgi:hypothetical protein
MIAILKVEEDGHFNGGKPDRSWCAEIVGLDPKYGFARSFVGALRDYKGAHASMAGRVYGIVSHYPLHDGRVYEVSRYRGRPSRRYVSREFITVNDGEIVTITSEEAMAKAIELERTKPSVGRPTSMPTKKTRTRNVRA